MKELLNKLSSYDFFNCVLPGVVFVALADPFAGYSFTHDDLLVSAFLYYFIGLVIGRFGSLVIEPSLKRLGFLHFADYEDFVAASKKDEKIEVLSETNNTYRTVCAMLFLLLFLKLYGWLSASLPGLQAWDPVLLITVITVMFVLAHRKQTAYIAQRIKVNE